MTARLASGPQCDYIRSLAKKHKASEADLLEIFGKPGVRIEQLRMDEASRLLDWLINTSAGEIGRLVAKTRGQLEMLA